MPPAPGHFSPRPISLTFPRPSEDPSRSRVPDLVGANGWHQSHLSGRLDRAGHLPLALGAEARAVAAEDHSGVVDKPVFFCSVGRYTHQRCVEGER